ncbi:MAG TPA: hypothetical protein VMV94_12220, partial [Phycisphaerae bacterium]|nr:hypothetical protein [Phycisphaerae bacterium]
PRWGFKAHGRPGLGFQGWPPRPYGPRHRPQGERHAMHPRQFLPADIGIAAVLLETRGQPTLQTLQRMGPSGPAIRLPSALAQIVSNRVLATAYLPGEPFDSST